MMLAGAGRTNWMLGGGLRGQFKQDDRVFDDGLGRRSADHEQARDYGCVAGDGNAAPQHPIGPSCPCQHHGAAAPVAAPTTPTRT